MQSNTLPITCTIITKNESKRIDATLKSANWCNEIIVVDSGSTDNTVDICKKYNAKFIHKDFHGFGEQKAFATNQAKNEWILNIDADEIITDQLKEEITDLFTKNNLDSDSVYFVRIPLLFMNKKLSTFKASGNVRLFNRKTTNFTSCKVHEKVQHKNNIIYLNGELLHRSYDDLEHYFEKLNLYTTKAASTSKYLGSSNIKIITKALFTFPFVFSKYYLLKGHFRQGVAGFIWSYLCAIYPAIKMFKIYERNLKN